MLSGLSSAQRNPPNVPWYRALKSVRTSVQISPARTTAGRASVARAAGSAAAGTDRVDPSLVPADAFIIAWRLGSELLNLLAQPQRLFRIRRFDLVEDRERPASGHVARIAFDRFEKIPPRPIELTLQHGNGAQSGGRARGSRVEIAKGLKRRRRFLQPPHFGEAQTRLP